MSTDHKEIEKKYLLRRMPELPTANRRPIAQGYLVADETELRLRRSGRTCTLTAKSDGGLERQEWETEIPEWVFDALWPRTEGARVVKDRYTVPAGIRLLEVDVFRDDLDGLLLLEVELPSTEEAASFRLPPWAGDALDVTDDPAYKNKRLALHGAPSPEASR